MHGQVSDTGVFIIQVSCVESCADRMMKATYRMTSTAVQLGPMGSQLAGGGGGM